MSPPHRVDIAEVIDRCPFGAFQMWTFALIGACLMIDGFDVQSIGYVAPAIIQDWGIPNAEMGPVFSAGLVGLFLGSLGCSMLADRVGRRPVILGASLVFALLTLLTARAASLPELLALRFLAGLGLGAILPNATALIGEYSPVRHRILATMVVTNGFTVGAMLGGFVSAWLIPAYGWRSVFVFGGLVPLVLWPALYAWLPESMQFLALRGRNPRGVERWIRRVDPQAPLGPDTVYIVRETRREGFPLPQLFAEGRGMGTLLLWVVNFTNVLNAYFVSSWLPTLVRDAGYTTSTAVLVGTAVQAGGAVGTLALGWLAQRIGFVPVLTACFAIEAVNLALLGVPGLSLGLLFVVAALTGLGIFGGQPGVNALAASFYPTDLRATGIGAGLGVGRFGAMLGPVLAGELIRNHWSSQDLFQVAVAPAVVAMLAIVAMRWAMKSDGPSTSRHVLAH